MALTWTQHATGTGCQVIKATVSGGVAGTAIITKNDGSILKPVTNESSFTGVDQQYLSATTLYVTILDTVTDYATHFTTNPYTMMYQRTSSIVEEITVEGDLVVSGATQITVGSEFTYATDPDTGKRTYTITPTTSRTGANLTDVKVTYDQSMKSAFDSAMAKQSDIATTVSVHDMQIYRMLLAMKNNNWTV